MLPAGTYNVKYQEDMAIVRTKLQWGLVALLVVVIAIIPFFVSGAVLSFLIMIACTIVAVHGLNILTGYCGQISLGHSAFIAVGAYASGILTTRLGFPFWVTLPLAGIAAGLVGMVFGAPSLRVKGFYLCITTLAAQFIIIWVIMNTESWTQGTRTLFVPPPTIGGFVFDTDMRYYFLAMGVAGLATLLAKNLARTGMGRAFIAIRDNDIAAEGMGINIYYYKMLAFFIGCFFAGVSGSLYGHYVMGISIEYYTLMDSIWYLGMLIVGGMGSALGVILGVVVIRGLWELVMRFGPLAVGVLPMIGPEFSAAIGMFLIGLVIMLFLVFEPRGMAHRWEIFKARYRLFPFPY